MPGGPQVGEHSKGEGITKKAWPLLPTRLASLTGGTISRATWVGRSAQED